MGNFVVYGQSYWPAGQVPKVIPPSVFLGQPYKKVTEFEIVQHFAFDTQTEKLFCYVIFLVCPI
jgi:hypothetical protein